MLFADNVRLVLCIHKIGNILHELHRRVSCALQRTFCFLRLKSSLIILIPNAFLKIYLRCSQIKVMQKELSVISCLITVSKTEQHLDQSRWNAAKKYG